MVGRLCLLASLLASALLLLATPATAHKRKMVVTSRVMAYWTRVAMCETGGLYGYPLWDWGSKHRPLEGHTYEGGVGFYWQTWRAWAGELHLLRRFPHAYDAPKDYQALVAQYGLTHYGNGWGCIH